MRFARVNIALSLNADMDRHADTCAACQRAVMDVTARPCEAARTLGRNLSALVREMAAVERVFYHKAVDNGQLTVS